MSRNRYAVILLVVLALTLWLAGRYVNRTTATLCNELQTACTLAETGQMPQAQQAYRAAADNAAQASKVLGMLVRRNLIDQMNQTLSLLPGCAKEENLTDHPRDGPGLLPAATDTAIIFRQFLIGCPACPSILP